MIVRIPTSACQPEGSGARHAPPYFLQVEYRFLLSRTEVEAFTPLATVLTVNKAKSLDIQIFNIIPVSCQLLRLPA